MAYAIILDTAFHTGDLDGDYTHIIISETSILSDSISFKIDYGRLIGSIWSSGNQYKQKIEVYLDPPAYVSFLETQSLGGEQLEEFMFDFFFGFALSQYPSLSGTKVEY